MSDDQHIKDFQDKLKAFFVESTSLVIDSLFLVLWIIAQWAVNEYIVQRFILGGIDQWMLEVFQKVFADF